MSRLIFLFQREFTNKETCFRCDSYITAILSTLIFLQKGKIITSDVYNMLSLEAHAIYLLSSNPKVFVFSLSVRKWQSILFDDRHVFTRFACHVGNTIFFVLEISILMPKHIV